MNGSALVPRAVDPLISLVRRLPDEALDRTTPCDEFDLRRLVNHLLFWGPALVGAASKVETPPAGEDEATADLTFGEWQKDLVDLLEQLDRAWSQPASWEGFTTMGGPDPFPASVVGGMVLGEIVIHGWDLAQAVGEQVDWDAEVVAAVHDEVAGTAEMGRGMGIYGPEVAVDSDAAMLDRALGLTGRDPAWTPNLD